MLKIWFWSIKNYNIHTWIVKPFNFNVCKMYLLIYAIHSSLQTVWLDSWSKSWQFCWNLTLFSKQKYVIVTSNLISFTDYEQIFVNNVINNWDRWLYQNLMKDFKFVKNEMTFVNISFVVMLRISYDRYMINWIVNQLLKREFKMLVAECASFSTLNMYTQDIFW